MNGTIIFIVSISIITTSLAVVKTDCRIVQCETKLAFEYAVQISNISEFSITESQCQAKYSRIGLENYFAVFCPDQFYCGRDVDPVSARKGGLGFDLAATCYLYGTSEDQCQVMEKRLKENG